MPASFRDTASHGVDGVQRLRPGTPQPPCTTEPIPQLRGSYTAYTGLVANMFLFWLVQEKNVQIIITLEYNANPPKKNPISAKQRSNLNLWSHSSPCFTPKSMTFVVHISIQLALFAVPWNSTSPLCCQLQGQRQTVMYSPIKTDCQYLPDLGQIQY